MLIENTDQCPPAGNTVTSDAAQLFAVPVACFVVQGMFVADVAAAAGNTAAHAVFDDFQRAQRAHQLSAASLAYNTYTNRNSASHTTSTKCQYQATASKAKWFSSEK